MCLDLGRRASGCCYCCWVWLMERRAACMCTLIVRVACCIHVTSDALVRRYVGVPRRIGGRVARILMAG